MKKAIAGIIAILCFMVSGCKKEMLYGSYVGLNESGSVRYTLTVNINAYSLYANEEEIESGTKTEQDGTYFLISTDGSKHEVSMYQTQFLFRVSSGEEITLEKTDNKPVYIEKNEDGNGIRYCYYRKCE